MPPNHRKTNPTGVTLVRQRVSLDLVDAAIASLNDDALERAGLAKKSAPVRGSSTSYLP